MLYWYGVFILSIFVLVWALFGMVRHIRRHHALALQHSADSITESTSHSRQD